jgi:hypothetical protein
MDVKLTKYSCWCPEHAETLDTDYRTPDDGPPTHCPLNEAHTNISGIAIVDVRDETIKRTRIIDSDTLDPDLAVSCTEDIVVPIVAAEMISKKDISFPFDINVIAAEYYVDYDEWNREDYFEAWGIAAGDPPIGALTADAAVDDTIINVSPTVFENMRPGYYVDFQDHTENGHYRVDEMDSGAGTITLDRGLTEAVVTGKTLHPRRPFVPRKYTKYKAIRRIGDLQSGSSPLDAGDILRIHYHHKNAPTVADWLAYTIIYMF